MGHNCRCQIITKRDQLAELLANFPHPRNEPGQAVDALHQARELTAGIRRDIEEKKAGRTPTPEG